VLWFAVKLQETLDGVILDVHVKPKSHKFKVEIDGDQVVVSCREAPVKGKVNRELLKQLSRLFGHKVTLVSGATSRQKRLLVSGVGAEEANRTLLSAVDAQQ
jgi:uncharacterized protein (TIGR00251 family)